MREILYLGTTLPPATTYGLYLGNALPALNREVLPYYPENQFDYLFDIPQNNLILSYTSGFKSPRYRIVNGDLVIDYDGAEPNLTINGNGELIATY